MPNILSHPFLSPLSKMADEITPSRQDKHRADQGYEHIKSVIKKLSEEGSLPPILPSIVTIVGSRLRDTDVAPIHHIDLFLDLDPSLVDIHGNGNTLNLVTKDKILSTCIDESLHVLPTKLVATLQEIFSKTFPTKITNSAQGLKIQLEKDGIEVRITPAFSSDNEYFIPQEKSELLWRKVSPLKEKEMLDTVNTSHNGLLIPTIRCLKLWNQGRNNESFRNYHVEAIAYFIFGEIPTPAKNILDMLGLYVDRMSKYIHNCPDPTGLDQPLHNYLPDRIDMWYMHMNRISELKETIKKGEKAVVELLRAGVTQT